MTDPTVKLLRMKEKLENARSQSDQLQGRIDGIMGEMKERFNCKSLKELKTKIKQSEKESAELEDELEQGVDSLEEKYEWNS